MCPAQMTFLVRVSLFDVDEVPPDTVKKFESEIKNVVWSDLQDQGRYALGFQLISLERIKRTPHSLRYKANIKFPKKRGTNNIREGLVEIDEDGNYPINSKWLIQSKYIF